MRIARTTAIAIAIVACLAAAPAHAASTPATVKVVDTAQVMTAPDHGGGMAAMMMMMHRTGSITVQGTGQVEYTPDIAHLTLGINGEAASAEAAAADIASRANAVITALKGLNIAAGDIQTSGYTLYYRQPAETVKAAFVASENISVKTSVDKAGQAIDAGLHAGANQTYGLTFDTSRRDALFRQAVDSAVRAARAIAQTAASAAGVKLGAVISIDVPAVYGGPIVAPMVRMTAAAPAPPPVAPGTGTMNATVSVSYSIPPPPVLPTMHP